MNYYDKTPTQDKTKFSVAIKTDKYQQLINNTLGDKEVSRRFVAEISTLVSQNPMLQECDAGSILSAGLLAQTINLSLAPALGLTYVVPWKDKNGVRKAQFQVGYKGYIQLAQRTGQFERLGVREVHEGEYAGQDEFGDDIFKFSHEFDNKPIIGYYAYFRLLNGFQKTIFWTIKKVTEHAEVYSKSYGNNKGTDLWSSSFDLMACKTVIKLLLKRYAPLSTELVKAVQADQAVVNTDGSYDYVDSPTEETPKLKTTVKNTIIPEKETENDIDFKEIEVNEDGVVSEEKQEESLPLFNENDEAYNR